MVLFIFNWILIITVTVAKFLGGPLINTNGKVIGINNFKIQGGESLGFALESDYILTGINNIAQESINQTIFWCNVLRVYRSPRNY